MRTTVHGYDSPAVFMAAAGDWLLADEAANNLILGIVRKIEADPGQYEAPVLLTTLHREGRVVGCAWRTPPFKLGLTDMPVDAVLPLVIDVNRLYPSLPAVLGPPAVAEAFAREWSQRTGVATRPGMRQRIYALERVVPPAEPPPGTLRFATADDLELVTGWVAEFTREAKVPMPRAPDYAESMIRARRLFIWDDGGPRTMVGWGADTPNGVRVGPVYTPPQLRGRGYASAATAAASQRALDAGRRMCFLYTDLANPTSNGIYSRIGYRPVTDAMDWEFGG